MADQENELKKIRDQMRSLEVRLRRLEIAMAYSPDRELPVDNEELRNPMENPPVTASSDEDKGLEAQIGRFFLAWMGNIVLLVGITFLTEYMMSLNHQLAAILLGYFAATSIFLISGYLKGSNQHLSFIFRMNAQAILFFVTLRLHFFSSHPLVGSVYLSSFLLILIIAFQVFLAVREKSQTMGGLAVIFALVTAIISDSTLLTPGLIILVAAGAVYWFRSSTWKSLLITSIILTYLSSFIWMIGNPVIGHPVKLTDTKHLVTLCMFALGGIYSFVLYFRDEDPSFDDLLISVTMINGLLFTFLLSFVAISYFSSGYVGLFTGIMLICLIYSVILHSRSSWNFASAFYALYGFMAMSIAIYGLLGFPKVYVLLSVQSLLVVSMALWFRNRLIVVMNSLLFLLILGIYIVSSKSNNGANFGFALVALISARVINWQKSRLQIKTELIRNLYMIEGFIMVLIALIHAVPKQFVTLSWTMAALVYFLLSLLLRNVKYRYMALGTMISAAIYLFIVDLARIEIIYRVLALLFLAAISIGISIYYSNRLKKGGNQIRTGGSS